MAPIPPTYRKYMAFSATTTNDTFKADPAMGGHRFNEADAATLRPRTTRALGPTATKRASSKSHSWGLPKEEWRPSTAQNHWCTPGRKRRRHVPSQAAARPDCVSCCCCCTTTATTPATLPLLLLLTLRSPAARFYHYSSYYS
jgi:hypothetical protein